MGRRPLFLVMHEARKDFRALIGHGEEEAIAACLAFGIVHLYVAERHRARHLYHPLALWHFWMATRLANRAIELRKSQRAGTDGVHAKFSSEEAKVAAEILDRVPYKLGGNSRIADNLRKHKREDKDRRVSAGVRADTFITLGRGYQHIGETDEAKKLYHFAESLIPELASEDPHAFPTPKYREMTIRRRLGFSYFDYPLAEDKDYGELQVARAIDIARERFPGAYDEIQKEWRQRKGFKT